MTVERKQLLSCEEALVRLFVESLCIARVPSVILAQTCCSPPGDEREQHADGAAQTEKANNIKKGTQIMKALYTECMSHCQKNRRNTGYTHTHA